MGRQVRGSITDKRSAMLKSSNLSEVTSRISKLPVSPRPNDLLQRSKLIAQKSKFNEEKSFLAKLRTWWNSIKEGSVIWICRLVAFFWVYCYHDIQSVIILLWLLHSSLFKYSSTFKKWMLYFYMPCFIVLFLWYYVINIFGLLKFWPDPDDVDHKALMYTYGFF